MVFAPEDAFGAPGADPRTTTPILRDARALWNRNEGIATIEGEIIDPVRVNLSENGLELSFQGNVLTMYFLTASVEDVDAIGRWVVQMTPPILSIHLEVPVWLKEFKFDVGGKQYSFGVLGGGTHTWFVTSPEHSSAQIERSLRDALNLQEDELRLISAMHYYRHAIRLSRLDPDRESMVAEVILNLTKAIEILASDNRETIRKVSANLGFKSDEIESRIIPLVLIRSRLDVAHVATGPLSVHERAVVRRFSDTAIVVVREFILRAQEGVRTGAIRLRPLSASLEKEKSDLLQRIATYIQ